ncbi:MAG: hypothetical protein HY819_13265, partial [Acidobacteria bacterium]|nr:hypothetical protein [Acidobacteriota bacterium]
MRFKTLVVATILAIIWIAAIGTNTSSYAYSSEDEKDKNIMVENKNSNYKANTEGKDEKVNNPTPSVEEQMFLLNEKVRKLEELVEKQQRVIEVLQTKASETNTPRTNTTIV